MAATTTTADTTTTTTADTTTTAAETTTTVADTTTTVADTTTTVPDTTTTTEETTTTVEGTTTTTEETVGGITTPITEATLGQQGIVQLVVPSGNSLTLPVTAQAATGQLPRTGSSAIPVALGGLTLLAAGALAMITKRRRHFGMIPLDPKQGS